MNSYYVGSDLKFRIHVECEGFSMADDNFTVTLLPFGIKYDKQQLIEGDDGDYFFIVNNDKLKPGVLKAKVTAYVPDPDFADGIRKEVEVVELCTIKKTL